MMDKNWALAVLNNPTTESVKSFLDEYAKDNEKTPLDDNMFLAGMQLGLIDQAYNIASNYFMDKFNVIKLIDTTGNIIKYY